MNNKRMLLLDEIFTTVRNSDQIWRQPNSKPDPNRKSRSDFNQSGILVI